MYLAMHPALESYLALLKEGCEEAGFFERLLDAFLKSLKLFGVPSHMILEVRRGLQLVGSIDEKASKGVKDLESLLRRHDLLLGPQMGGFGNLLQSAITDQEICDSEELDFSGLDPDLQTELKSIGDAASKLMALDDIVTAFSLSPTRVSSCIVLHAITLETVCKDALRVWIERKESLQDIQQLLAHAQKLSDLDAKFINCELHERDVQEFCIWLMVLFVEGEVRFEPLQKRFIDALLKNAGLGSLALFENVKGM